MAILQNQVSDMICAVTDGFDSAMIILRENRVWKIKSIKNLIKKPWSLFLRLSVSVVNTSLLSDTLYNGNTICALFQQNIFKYKYNQGFLKLLWFVVAPLKRFSFKNSNQICVWHKGQHLTSSSKNAQHVKINLQLFNAAL